MSRLGKILLGTACAVLFVVIQARAATNVTVDPGASWVGFMNVFDIPQNVASGPYPTTGPGPYVFGSGWGTSDLIATFSGSVLSLKPNSVGDPSTFWYIGGGGPGAVGNKITDANMYVEIGSLPGQTLTFSGLVLANTLTFADNPSNTDPLGNGWTAVAFIKDFASDYSSFVGTTVPLTAGPFSISLPTINDPARHVQYGFEVIGPDVWITDNGTYGSVQVTAVPEPSSIALVLTGLSGLFAFVWKKRRI